MTRVVFVDGAIAADELLAIASPLERCSGVGAFEVFRTHKGRLPTMTRHLARLAEALDGVGISVDFARMRADIERATALVEGEARIDVRVERVDAGVRDTVIATPFEPPSGGTRVSAALVSAARVTRDGRKWLAYHEHGSALAAARRRGFEDAIILDDDGLIREAATSNVFLRTGTRLATAGEEVLPGITRGFVLEVAHALGLSVNFTAASRDDLYTCDEVWLTSSLRGLATVTSIEGREVGGRGAEQLAASMAAAIEDRICQLS